jgi:hypothetical protein
MSSEMKPLRSAATQTHSQGNISSAPEEKKIFSRILMGFAVGVGVILIVSLRVSFGSLSASGSTTSKPTTITCRGECFQIHTLIDQYPDAICNDGTPFAFYTALRPESNVWVISLSPGMGCNDIDSCASRKKDSPWWVTNSALVDSEKDVAPNGGALSDDCTKNPHWCNVNRIFIPYCSSDAYLGYHSMIFDDTRWDFNGFKCLEATMYALYYDLGMSSAEEIIYTGQGAGGNAAIFSLDYFQQVFDNLHAGLDAPLWTGWPADDEESMASYAKSTGYSEFAHWPALAPHTTGPTFYGIIDSSWCAVRNTDHGEYLMDMVSWHPFLPAVCWETEHFVNARECFSLAKFYAHVKVFMYLCMYVVGFMHACQAPLLVAGFAYDDICLNDVNVTKPMNEDENEAAVINAQDQIDSMYIREVKNYFWLTCYGHAYMVSYILYTCLHTYMCRQPSSRGWT